MSMEGFGEALRSAGVGLSTDDKIRIWRAVCDGTSCSPNDVTIAKLNLFLQNVVEVESDPNAFILTSLINRGDTGHAVRKSIPGAKTVFMNDLDLKWHEAIPDKTRQYVGDQEVKSKAHFGHEARVGGKNALPWEEQFAETGHADSAALHKNDVEGQHMHHYKEGEVDVALPWMDHFSSEGTVSTNLHRRIVNRVNSLSPKNFKELVSALKLHSHAQQLNIDRKEHAGRPLSRKDQVDFNNVRGDEHVSRITLRQSLGETGVHVGPTDIYSHSRVLDREPDSSKPRRQYRSPCDNEQRVLVDGQRAELRQRRQRGAQEVLGPDRGSLHPCTNPNSREDFWRCGRRVLYYSSAWWR